MLSNSGLKNLTSTYKKTYYYGHNIYIITSKDNKINVQKNKIENCVNNNCDLVKISNQDIENKPEYQSFIQKFFNGIIFGEITITNNLLSNEDNQLLAEILNEDFSTELSIQDINYEVSKTDGYNQRYLARGYYLEQLDDGRYLLTIAMGEKSTGGYSIEVTNITVIDGIAQILVKESSPNMNGSATQALTYPTTQVILNELPETIIVINKENFISYKNISNMINE